ncbi:helix-turn-helix transcriptional regulator [Nonomuraea sp. NPDC050022]|uniref:helix-turn-helix transcriptional regulator n=1 Tax=Nonomuraea sp. NPDC050022 TaxID=3364358 RepID=UPI0037B8AA25
MSGNGELATILRVWRERLLPRQAGLPTNGLRRTRGLRREELAMLAGVSADYIVRLEQGRASTPSAQVCAALARALQLDDAEQTHLFLLAGHAVGSGRIGQWVPASVRRLLNRLDDHPIAVHDAMWTLILWNRPWAALMGDPSALDEEERHMLWRAYTGQPHRIIMTLDEWTAFERSMVADLRRTAARYPDDPRLHAFVQQLRELSDSFRTLWDAHLVSDHHQATKSVDHPEVGRIDLDCDILTTQHGDLRIVIYTAQPGSESETKLALLDTIGTQTMTPG